MIFFIMHGFTVAVLLFCAVPSLGEGEKKHRPQDFQFELNEENKWERKMKDKNQKPFTVTLEITEDGTAEVIVEADNPEDVLADGVGTEQGGWIYINGDGWEENDMNENKWKLPKEGWEVAKPAGASDQDTAPSSGDSSGAPAAPATPAAPDAPASGDSSSNPTTDSGTPKPDESKKDNTDEVKPPAASSPSPPTPSEDSSAEPAKELSTSPKAEEAKKDIPPGNGDSGATPTKESEPHKESDDSSEPAEAKKSPAPRAVDELRDETEPPPKTVRGLARAKQWYWTLWERIKNAVKRIFHKNQ